ncbi:MAG: cell division protein FtsQ [Paludibacter sp.]
MKPVWKNILISFFSLLVLGYIGFSLWQFSGRNQVMVCGQLVVIIDKNAECQLITEKEVVNILESKELNPIGKTVRDIQTESIEMILHKNPMIKSVECYKLPSGRVDIIIQQRVPKLRVVGLGSYYIDADRKPMPVSLNCAAYVPVVSGHVTVTMVTGKLYDFVMYLKDNTFWNAQVEQIYVREDQKIELVPRVGDAIILLGTLENYEKKLEKLHKLYKYGFNVIGWNKYKLIDLEYKDQIVCNKKEEVKSPVKFVVDSLKKIDKLKKDSIIAKKI